MANTIRTYVGDGSRVIYPVDFELGYLREEFVFVYSGEDYQTQLDYTWVDSSQIQLVTPVALGTELHIRRVVPRDALVVSFTNGAVLKHKNLDNSALQPLMILEEIADGYLTLNGSNVIYGELLLTDILNMNGNVIEGLGEPVQNTDATNKEYVDAADNTRISKAGDTMIGTLHVIDNTATTSAVTRGTVIQSIDNAVKSISGEFGVNKDYGFINESVTEILDYGSLQ